MIQLMMPRHGQGFKLFPQRGLGGVRNFVTMSEWKRLKRRLRKKSLEEKMKQKNCEAVSKPNTLGGVEKKRWY